MKLAQFSIFGLLVQGLSLVAFILVSRTNWADLGKPLLIVFAFTGISLLLWRGVRNASGLVSLCLLPATLAVDYMVAFHLVGLLGFSGLLRDARSPFGKYLFSLLRVTIFLFALYAIATTLLFVFNRAWRRGRRPGTA